MEWFIHYFDFTLQSKLNILYYWQNINSENRCVDNPYEFMDRKKYVHCTKLHV